MSDLANSAIGVYPPDIYDAVQQAQFYGTGVDEYDRESFLAINRARGNPDAEIVVYRGVPPGVTEINPGDWVTTSRGYAEDQAAKEPVGPLEAEGEHPGGVVISRTVRAGDLYTDGNSINEWGWHPKAPAAAPPRIAGLGKPPPDVAPPAPPTKFAPPYPPSEAARFGADRLWGAHAEIGKAENLARAELPALRDDQLAPLLWEKGMGRGLGRGTLRLEDVAGDQQVHTVFSDGHNAVYEVADAARARGEQQVVISDHSHLMTSEEIATQHAQIDAYNANSTDFKILKGIEVNIFADGTLDTAPEVLARFDVVNAAIHAPIQGPAGQLALFKEANTARFLRAMDDPELNVLVHPGSVGADWDAVAAKASQKGVALEVNGRDLLRNDRQEAYSDMIDAAKRHGAKLVLGSDAHTADDLVDLVYAVRFAAQHGVTRDDLAPIALRARAGEVADVGSTIPASLDTSTASGAQTLGGGMNEVWKVDTRDGREFVVKPPPDLDYYANEFGIDEENPLRRNIAPGSDLERERAAYLVSRYFNQAGGEDFHVDVPPYRIGEFRRPEYLGYGETDPGNLITGPAGAAEFVPGVVAKELMPSWSSRFSPAEIRSAALYDAVIGNTDRHAGNFLLGDDGKLWLIDHGLSFPAGVGDPDFQNTDLIDDATMREPRITDREASFLERLRAYMPQIRRELGDLLSPDELRDMAERIDSMLKTRDFSDAAKNQSGVADVATSVFASGQGTVT